MKSITEQIRAKYDLMDDHSARIESLEFYQRIIEDIAIHPVLSMKYESEHELITADLGWTKIIINVAMDSLRSCTIDVISQTNNWKRENL